MNDEAEKAGAMRSSLRSWAPSITIVIAIWLAWQIFSALIVVRGPPLLAIRFAPSSPLALARAAEAEMIGGRSDSAEALASRSIELSPFQVRALRVLGLAEAEEGNEARADELLTLAGNWSLRDDPSHGWLIERRLEQGDYRSALAHADTIVRRRSDMAAPIFNLFTTAALLDPRVEPVLAERLAVAPPWGRGYIRSLYQEPENLPLLPRLAIRLENTPGRFNNTELGILYRNWVANRRLAGLTAIRSALSRPPMSLRVVDGDFSGKDGVEPFAWALGVGPGLFVIEVEDDLRSDNTALRVEYNGRGSTVLAEQLLLLKPGTYRLRGESRSESAAEPRIEWAVICFEANETIGRYRQHAAEAGQGWRPFQFGFTVPAENCTAQYLRLRPLPEVRHAVDIVWYDNISVSAGERR